MTTPARLNNNVLTTYGLGVGVHKQLGHPAVLHDGAVIGFQSFLVYFSEQDMAIAVNVNTFPSPGVVYSAAVFRRHGRVLLCLEYSD